MICIWNAAMNEKSGKGKYWMGGIWGMCILIQFPQAKVKD